MRRHIILKVLGGSTIGLLNVLENELLFFPFELGLQY